MKLVGQEKERKSDTAPARPTPPAPTGPGAQKAAWLPKTPAGRTWLWLVLVLAGNFWLARVLMPGPEAPVTVPYTLFKEEVGKGNVQAIYAGARRHRPLQGDGHLPAARLAPPRPRARQRGSGTPPQDAPSR